MTPKQSPSQSSSSSVLTRLMKAFQVFCRGMLESLPGQLFMLTIVLVAVSVVLVYFPAVSNFRVQWMKDRAESAYLAALAADVAEDEALAEEQVRRLLEGVDAIAVSRVREGRNELVLSSGPQYGPMIVSDLTETSWLMHIRDTTEALFAPAGRLLRIRAEPEGRAGELIDVTVREVQLKAALNAFSRRIMLYSFLVAMIAGGIIYLALFFLFVRPMHRLAESMIRFRDDPEDPGRTVVPSGDKNEIGRAEIELAQMQDDVRQALRQRERLAALGGAVAKINHDLRNVLTTAQLVSDRLATDKDARVKSMGERLVRAVDRGVRLCETTLDYGRAEETPPARVDVNAHTVIDEAAGDAMQSEGAVKWTNSVDSILMLNVDPDHTHRIFLNLFRNAIQAMQTRDGDSYLGVTAISDGQSLVVEVTDNGPGLPEKAREHLFDAFTGSTRKGGSGLGLSISRELARAHGGDITLVSSSKEGTVFGVRLPRTLD